MADFISERLSRNSIINGIIIGIVLIAAAILGILASPLWLGLLLAVVVGLVLLNRPILGLFALMSVALFFELSIPTGSDVVLNPATLLVPGLLAVVLVSMLRRQDVHIGGSRVFLPLALFLLANLISLLIGNALWDPMVPRSSRFILVQFAQWSIYAFSAFAFWLSSYLIRSRQWLWWLTASFLILGGILSIVFVIPGNARNVQNLVTVAVTRAPFWLLLMALAGGQLFFNGDLTKRWRFFLLIVVAVTIYFAFVAGRESASNWISVGIVIVVLVAIRWPRLRWLALLFILGMAAAGVLLPTIWNFAGGELEWQISGGSRLALAERVWDVTMRNPITGLGPAAYRNYAAMTPLPYLGAFWTQPQISSHNNYLDIFSQAGIIGLMLFIWFVVEVFALLLRLRGRVTEGFELGYVYGMFAVCIGALAIMLFADWILPFVYNIGFPGFQASVLVWLFLGGLVALERQFNGEPSKTTRPE